jgi:GC-rich sequence DNA-binding factor
MLKSVHTVFDSATSTAEDLLAPFVKLNHPPFDPEAAPARQRLLSRAVKLLENMLRWRKYTGDRHAVGRLCARLVNECILPIAESGWEVGGEGKVRQAIAILPQELTSSIRAPLTAST